MMMLRPAQQRGDTIIEVLLAMAVVGMVLGSSYGIANRSLRLGQSARDRTVALKIAESQIELMKTLKTDTAGFGSLTSNFCVLPSDPIRTVTVTDSSPVGSNECLSTGQNGGVGIYNVFIEPPSVSGIDAYAVNVTWNRLGAVSDGSGSEIDTLTLYYKLGVL